MRTWEENKNAINQLWPMVKFTDEERRLWHDDLGGLDQDVLYDAIRNVKRNTDGIYPQLKWFRDEYRHLFRIRSFVSKKTASESEPKQIVRIDSKGDARMRDELRVVVEMATPADKDSTVDLIADKAATHQIEMATAFRLVQYLLERLGLACGNVYGGKV